MSTAGRRTVAAIVNRSYGGWRGYALAVAAVAVCVLLRVALEPLGQFYYLPMVPAAVATALLSRPGPTVLAIVLSVAVNVFVVPREGLTDTLVNALLFVMVSWLLAEICWAQRAVRERSEALARTLADSTAVLDTVLAAVPVVILDRDGRVQRLTPAASELFGVATEDIRDAPFSRLVEDFDLRDIAAGATAGPLRPQERVWRGRRPDGGELALSLQIGVTARPDGGDYAAVCATDVTETQAATARARDLDAQLNRVWRLNSLGQMAATLSHELNQPLSAAASYLHASQRDVERAGPLGESAGRTMELAKAQILRAGGIIRRMRDLVATGEVDLRRERVSSMMEDLAPALRLLGRDHGIDVRLEIETGADAVLAERIQFQQAIINLGRNAIEAASAASEPVVVISGRPADSDYVVSVEDNGPGLPSEDLEFALRPMASKKAAGMGLGLSVTRTIVEGHGGELLVGPSRFGGAAFSIRLPREEHAA